MYENNFLQDKKKDRRKYYIKYGIFSINVFLIWLKLSNVPYVPFVNLYVYICKYGIKFHHLLFFFNECKKVGTKY